MYVVRFAPRRLEQTRADLPHLRGQQRDDLRIECRYALQQIAIAEDRRLIGRELQFSTRLPVDGAQIAPTAGRVARACGIGIRRTIAQRPQIDDRSDDRERDALPRGKRDRPQREMRAEDDIGGEPFGGVLQVRKLQCNVQRIKPIYDAKARSVALGARDAREAMVSEPRRTRDVGDEPDVVTAQRELARDRDGRQEKSGAG